MNLLFHFVLFYSFAFIIPFLFGIGLKVPDHPYWKQRAEKFLVFFEKKACNSFLVVL